MSWLRETWNAFADSYDADEAVAGSSPSAVLLSALGLGGALAVLGYLPVIARVSHFERPWVSLLFVAMAASTTLLAWSHRCRGPVGIAGALLDNVFWAVALLWAVAHTRGGFSLGLALAYAAMVLGYTTRFYGLSLLFAVATSLPPLTAMLLVRHDAAVSLLLLAVPAVGLVNSAQTRGRRAMLVRQHRLETALGAAERVAEESLQVALAATLVDLGHFLHELKNNQTAVLANLAYLEEACDLEGEAREAVADARKAQQAEHRLVLKTVEELRARAKPVNTSFLLFDILDSAVRDARKLEAWIEGPRAGFVLSGNPDHLRSVLHNLVRNAAQAGAKHLSFVVEVEPGGHAVSVTVCDDGPGIPQALRANLFRAFVESTKINGSGLGLYLCRRYVELLGGSLSVVDSPLGGAAFRLLLPGRMVQETGWSVRRISLAVQALRS